MSYDTWIHNLYPKYNIVIFGITILLTKRPLNIKFKHKQASDNSKIKNKF